VRGPNTLWGDRGLSRVLLLLLRHFPLGSRLFPVSTVIGFSTRLESVLEGEILGDELEFGKCRVA